MQSGGLASFTNSGTGVSQILLSSLGPSFATATGAGTGSSFTNTTLGNGTVLELDGESSGLGSVAGLAYYGSLAGASQSTGYSTGFGGFSSTPASSPTASPPSGGKGSSSSSGKKKKSSSGMNVTVPSTPSASVQGYTSGTAGGTSLGSMYGLGVFSNGATFGTFGGLSLGSVGTSGANAAGGAQAQGRQESSGYAIGGGFNIGRN
jgi:hypothetical protein